MATIRSFLEWSREQGLEFGRWKGNDFVPTNTGTEELLHHQKQK